MIGGVLFSILLGVTVALGASPASTSAVLSAPKAVSAAPSTSPLLAARPTSSPTPGLTRRGRLQAPVAVNVAATAVVLRDSSQAAVVGDGSSTTAIAPPPGAQGLAVSLKNPLRAIAGGAGVQYTDDGGKTWRAVKTAPPAPAGVTALMIDPDDADVWFFQHGTRLLRTRDAGQSWRELPGVPNLASPVMAAGGKADQEVLWDGNFALVLDDNGQQVTVRDRAPQTLQSAAMLGSELLGAGADGHLYLSNAGGWTQVGGAGLVVAGAAGHAWSGDGGTTLGSPGRVIVTADGGAGTWTDATGLPSDQPVVGIGADRAGSIVVAYCLGGDVYRSQDGGATFTKYSTALRT